MTVYYKKETLHFVIISDDPHEIEEEIRGAAEDRDHSKLNDIFLTLYKENRTPEIEDILSRFFFSKKEIATALENLGEKVKEMKTDPDYAESMKRTHSKYSQENTDEDSSKPMTRYKPLPCWE